MTGEHAGAHAGERDEPSAASDSAASDSAALPGAIRRTGSIAIPKTARPLDRFSHRALTAFAVTGEVIGLLLQLLLVWVGAYTIWGTDVPEAETVLRFIWCGVAAIYLGATVIGLNIIVRFETPDPRAVRLLIGHPLTRMLSTVVGLGASLLGLTVATDLIASISAESHDVFAELSSITAMLLSWAMFNWGYARIYYSRYHRSSAVTLVFPGTAEPRLVDFVYLAFTNATTFAVSDVQVTDTRMRWTLVWHTTLAFFFNALILALTMNVIINGRMFADLLN